MSEALQQEQTQAAVVVLVPQDRPWQRGPHGPAELFAGSFGRAGSGTGCACFTGSPGDSAQDKGQRGAEGKIQAMGSLIWGLTPASQSCGGAGAQCASAAAPATGRELDQGGHGAGREGALADPVHACVAQDPPFARGSCQGVRVRAPCRLSPSGHSPPIAPVCSAAPVQSQPPGTAKCVTCTDAQHALTLQHAAATCLAHPALGLGVRTSVGSMSRQTRAWRQIAKPAHSLPCVQVERHNRDPALVIHTWGKLLLPQRSGVCFLHPGSHMCQPGMTTGVLSARNSIAPPRAVWRPRSGTFLVTRLLPILGDAAPPGQAGGCPVLCQQQDVRNPSHLILPWLPAGCESRLRNGDMCLGTGALS